MPEKQYDLLIIGAGVASASALIALKGQGLKIAVVAPKERPAFRIGETLGPAGTEELRKLGLLTAFREEGHWYSEQKFSCWGSVQLMRVPTHSGPNPGWYLDRIGFERFLWKHALLTDFEQPAEKVLRAEKVENLWEIETDHGVLFAQQLLDASGRAAVVARNHLKRQRHDKLVAAYVCLKQQTDEIAATRATMIEALPHGWFYSVLVPGNQLVVSWFTDSDLLPEGITQQASHWQALIDQTDYTKKRIETAGFAQTVVPKVVDGATITTDVIATTDLITAGDAATCFDPLSSHGMCTALWSGRRAAESIIGLRQGSNTELKAYVESFLKGTAKYLFEKQQIYGQEQRFLQHDFWKRRGPVR